MLIYQMMLISNRQLNHVLAVCLVQRRHRKQHCIRHDIELSPNLINKAEQCKTFPDWSIIMAHVFFFEYIALHPEIQSHWPSLLNIYPLKIKSFKY